VGALLSSHTSIFLRGLLVKEIINLGKTVYTCEICELGYADRENANACENHCRTHNACSLEITKKAIYDPFKLKSP